MNSIAYAQEAAGAAAPAGSSWISFIPIVLMILIFYFLLIRPQQKREKERKKMIDELQVGNRVLTSAGIYGVITNMKDDIVVIKIADGAKVEFAKSSVQQKVS